MRIRLRVPKDGEEKSQGLRGWFRRLFGISDEPEAPAAPEPAPEPAPAVDKSRIDRRWTQLNEDLAYLPAGRICLRPGDGWRSDYLFEVFAGGQFRRMRIQIVETALKDWEKANDVRMPEAGRFRLAKDRLEALLHQGQWPAEETVEPQSIAELKL